MIFLIFLAESPSTDEEWTCKKCTLVNQASANVCVVCGGEYYIFRFLD